MLLMCVLSLSLVDTFILQVTINVGGVRHEVMWAGLERRPLTRLGLLGRQTSHQSHPHLTNCVYPPSIL